MICPRCNTRGEHSPADPEVGIKIGIWWCERCEETLGTDADERADREDIEIERVTLEAAERREGWR